MGMVEAIFNGEVIARSDRTRVVECNDYFPLEDVDERFLRRARARSLCLCKGIASPYSVEVASVRGGNVACTYRHPSPLTRRIKSHVAFWGAVEVIDAARREAR